MNEGYAETETTSALEARNALQVQYMHKLLECGVTEEDLTHEWFDADDDAIGARFRTFIDCVLGQECSPEQQSLARQVQEGFLENEQGDEEEVSVFRAALMKFEPRHVSTRLH